MGRLAGVGLVSSEQKAPLGGNGEKEKEGINDCFIFLYVLGSITQVSITTAAFLSGCPFETVIY